MVKVFSRCVMGMLLACSGMAFAAQAMVINPTFVDGAGQSWDASRKGVITQAIGDWQSKIKDHQTVNITFTFSQAGSPGYLGQWNVTSQPIYVGTNIYPWTPQLQHTVSFNADYFTGSNYLWWDPTPTTAGDQPFAAYDALSVARHEVGHALGFANGFFVDNFRTSKEVDKWGKWIAPGTTTFDPTGLNVQLAATNNLSHVFNGGSTKDDLMTPALLNGQRRDISATDLQMLHLAYGYQVVPEPSSMVLLGIGLACAVAFRKRLRVR